MKRLLTIALVCAAGCDAETETEPTPAPPVCEDAEAAAPTVVWKRTGAVLADLSVALEVPRAELCKELGVADCGEVHRVTLGANDPFDKALYRPFAEPLQTTPLALERVVLQACLTRAALDQDASRAVVFKHFDLEASSVTGEEMSAQGTELYRRLLARDPSPVELEVLAGLRLDDSGAELPASRVAVMACLTVGTSREFLFL